MTHGKLSNVFIFQVRFQPAERGNPVPSWSGTSWETGPRLSTGHTDTGRDTPFGVSGWCGPDAAHAWQGCWRVRCHPRWRLCNAAQRARRTGRQWRSAQRATPSRRAGRSLAQAGPSALGRAQLGRPKRPQDGAESERASTVTWCSTTRLLRR